MVDKHSEPRSNLRSVTNRRGVGFFSPGTEEGVPGSLPLLPADVGRLTHRRWRSRNRRGLRRTGTNLLRVKSSNDLYTLELREVRRKVILGLILLLNPSRLCSQSKKYMIIPQYSLLLPSLLGSLPSAYCTVTSFHLTLNPSGPSLVHRTGTCFRDARGVRRTLTTGTSQTGRIPY